MTRPAPTRPASWAYCQAPAISSSARDHRLPLARRRHHGLDDARRAERGHSVADLLLGVAEAIAGRLEPELLGNQAPDALAIHRQPRGARRRHDMQPVLLELEQHGRRDRLELGNHQQPRARPRPLGLEHRAQGRGVGHVDHRVALRDLHRGRPRVAVDRQHLAPEPHRLDRHLTTQLATAEQHDAHGGVGQRRSRCEAHDRAAYVRRRRRALAEGPRPRRSPASSRAPRRLATYRLASGPAPP